MPILRVDTFGNVWHPLLQSFVEPPLLGEKLLPAAEDLLGASCGNVPSHQIPIAGLMFPFKVSWRVGE